MSVDLAQLRPRRVLLIKPSALGDVVHALPIARLLRRRWPGMRLSWLVTPAFAPILAGNDDIDDVIHFDRSGTASDESRGFFKMLGQLTERQFDLAIDLQGLARTGAMCAATRAPVRVGFAAAREGAPLSYTHRILPRPGVRHAVERYLDVTEALGAGRGPVTFPLPALAAGDAFFERTLPSDTPYAVLLPGTNWKTKRWPAKYFDELASRIAGEMGLLPVIAGARDARELAQDIPHALSVAGRTSLPQLVALMRRAHLVIANDSGPMHIASAVGVPLVSIFGPTDPLLTGPFGRPDSVVRLGISCSPCMRRKCLHVSCMNWLRPADIMRVARQQLRQGFVTN